MVASRFEDGRFEAPATNGAVIISSVNLPKRVNFWYGAVLAVLSLNLWVTYVASIDLRFEPGRLKLHEEIIHGLARSPYAYRVLAPLVAEGAMRLGVPFAVAYAVYDLAAIVFSLWAVGRLAGVLGRSRVLCVAAFGLFMLPGFANHYYQPWSLLEPGVWALAAVFAVERKQAAFTILVIVASLNRETAVFLPLLYVAFSRSAAAWSGLLSVATISIVRAVVGVKAVQSTRAAIWAANVSHWKLAGLKLSLTALPLLILLWLSRKSDKRLLIPCLPYLASIAVFGIWYEVRLLWPVAALMIPALLPVEP